MFVCMCDRHSDQTLDEILTNLRTHDFGRNILDYVGEALKTLSKWSEFSIVLKISKELELHTLMEAKSINQSLYDLYLVCTSCRPYWIDLR